MATRILDEADFVIVGTGAGGATAARLLTAAGHGVVLLEEGPNLPPEKRPAGLLEAMAQTFRDFGTTTTSGSRPFPLLQGRLVGGSTAINSGIIWRLPEDVRKVWIEEHGLGELVDERGLGDAFDRIDAELQVTETSRELFGGNCELLEEGSRKLGLTGKAMMRNAGACKGSARCLQGCPNLARQSMDVSYIPQAIRAGARLHALCRAERVLSEGGRAVGVTGVQLLDPVTRQRGERFEVRARRAVIVAGGAIQTPVLLRRSGLKGFVGERFQAHPGAATVGRFEKPVVMGFGATQGYEVPLRERGIKIEALGMPPEMLATRLPGAGAAWQERLANLGHFAQWACLTRMQAHGTVRPAFGGNATVDYLPLQEDLEKARGGVAVMARMMFAAGATEVYPGMAGKPEVLRSMDEVKLLEEGKVRQGDFHLMASHLFGTACAGSDPRRSAVGPDLQSHQLPGLYVMDAAVFPTNLGVNPQHSIMAVVWRAAERLAAAGRNELHARA